MIVAINTRLLIKNKIDGIGKFTYETLTICCILYLFLIPVSIFNYRSKLKNSQNQNIEEDQRDIL